MWWHKLRFDVWWECLRKLDEFLWKWSECPFPNTWLDYWCNNNWITDSLSNSHLCYRLWVAKPYSNRENTSTWNNTKLHWWMWNYATRWRSRIWNHSQWWGCSWTGQIWSYELPIQHAIHSECFYSINWPSFLWLIDIPSSDYRYFFVFDIGLGTIRRRHDNGKLCRSHLWWNEP